ncbi:response regulator [Roseovarius aestuarii]|nr:response regulator [Roseovarius aestuarii]
MRILLVDDDPVFRGIFSEKLALQGLARITLAASAEEALELVEQQRIPFDCFLLDIMLGDMDGIELCHRLRQHPTCKSAPIIMITSNQSASLIGQAFSAGATDFLRKPLCDIEIAGRIRMAMLLVAATKKERQGRTALRTLISCGADFNLIDLGERACFADIESMVDYHHLENHLLRMPQGQYQFSLFRVRMRKFRTMNRNLDRVQVMRQLHDVSSRISDAIPNKRLLFSYIGNGRFVCCIIGRDTKVSGLFKNPDQISACTALKNLATEDAETPALEVTSLSNMNILSRDAIVALVRTEFQASNSLSSDSLPQVDEIEGRIFAKINEVERKTTEMEYK